jgi:hypothetical protein
MTSTPPRIVPWLLLAFAWLGAASANGAPAEKNDIPPKDRLPKEVQSVLDEIGAPLIQASAPDAEIPFEAFSAETAAKYPTGGEETDLRKAVRKARLLLWALATATPPADMAEKVAAVRKDLKIAQLPLRDAYAAPANENTMRKQVLRDQTQAAALQAELTDVLEDLKTAGEKGRATENRRWQANYDATLARLQAQIVFMFEYQSMLGQMRKELPPLAAGQNGWKLVPQRTLQGDPEGKRLAREMAKLLDQIIAENPGTPWETLAKRLKETPLSVEWQGVVNK